MSQIICIYHAECMDGASAAAVVRYKYPQAKLIPAKHGDPVPQGLEKAKVFIVDFSYSPTLLKKIQGVAQEVHWFDHHKTAIPFQKEVGFGIVDLNESGATLTWKQLFPKKKVPKILQYVRDKDLWLWKLPHSREISADLREVQNIFDPTKPVWKKLLHGQTSKQWKEMIERGKHSRCILRQRLEKAAKRGFLAFLNGTQVFAVNWSEDSSDLGEMIYQELKHPVAAIFSYNGEGWTFSLRSNSVDVSKIAVHYGGGGHPGAAGFRTPNIEWLFSKV